MKLFLLSLFTIFNSLFADYLDVQFASFSYTIGGSYGSCVKFKKSEYSFSDFNECSCAWAANVSNYSDCYELYYNPQTKMIKYNLSEGGEYTYRNFSNDYTCHIYNEEMTILECSEFNEIGCEESSECEWVESIEYQSCGIYTVPSDCSVVDGCYWYAGSYYPAFQGCNGEFEVDSSYCEESEILACPDMGFIDCTMDDNCNWVENIESGDCNSLSTSECTSNPECMLDCVTTYDCFGCTGGSYNIDNSYCEEMQYQLGDINQDNTINVQDVIVTVNLVLNVEYNNSADMNSDNILNVLDIIQLVNMILN